MTNSLDFWDALAPYHAAVEDNYLDLASVRHILPEIATPVLVIGGGHGLVIEELRRSGLRAEGVDWSLEMIKHARLRRGIDLVHADARNLPFADRTYGTIIYATGVIDFTSDEPGIGSMLAEGRRLIQDGGAIFIAFYKVSKALETFMTSCGLLTNNEIAMRRSFELYLLNPFQMIRWLADQAGWNRFRATLVLLRMSVLCTGKERKTTLQMQRVIRGLENSAQFIQAVPETQPYRNEAAIRSLFGRLGLSISWLRDLTSCFMVRIVPRDIHSASLYGTTVPGSPADSSGK